MSREFNTGNVVKLEGGSIVIVVGERTVNYATKKSVITDWVSFDSENVSGATPNKTEMEDKTCYCDEGNGGEYDEFCETCKGTGTYESERTGMDKAKFLASNVKSYIMKRLTKNFEF